MGISYSHRIKAKQENAQVLNTDDFDVHWWLVQPEDMPPTQPLETPNFVDILGQLQQINDSYLLHQQLIFINSIKELLDKNIRVLNPVIVQTRGRPTTSTRRNPSSFELVEQKTYNKRVAAVYAILAATIPGHALKEI
ncbi:hypothetical protein GcC1_204030 [Golovinomyces cichoracearum]|uniref:Uncharacterized protein n=1 Tax=Golovinomyces cichoracearum TaxID=62708 RepID=A0A420HD48_9PEZI|nr:hypothetical protein GcC1_204030 [Golovinomyces cichoracearum]